ncbi:alpha/beta hydrolase [Flavobacterium aquicola]|uniref:Proline iminopeptidase n=1 Tax=Flavobacterium aquicola TaxID=1682742 RepID=A0A3E0ECU1_9FLAO|nr:alpha/beta hydrolase [Flavobacterium aquicola]REG96067.1 proline iminopeptidase [Flavobacterium aquicola]
MKQILLLFLLLTTFYSRGQNIYSKAFGNLKNKAIIFIHGGPSGNSTLFEYTTAEKLAEKGFYVIIYDRRGEGRSIDSLATFTYQEYFKDLNDIYKKYNIEKANIIGHSFGGLVATLFSEKYPQKVESLILAGALFSQQETYNNILKSVNEIYINNNDTLKLNQINEVKKLDNNSAEYRAKCFELASENNFFKMPKPTKISEKLREDYKNNIFENNIRNQNAPIMFYKNESLKNIETKYNLKKIKNQIKIYAVYGKQDRIFGESQINEIKEIVGEPNFSLIDNCSHYLFVDQQDAFINNLVNWLKK